jgi:hypothetical protein
MKGGERNDGQREEGIKTHFHCFNSLNLTAKKCLSV